MQIDELTRVLPPPDSPSEVPTPADWHDAETAIGTPLPADFKAFLGVYGTGCIDDFLYVYSPSARDQNVNLVARGRRTLEAMRVSKESHPDYYRLDIFPAPSGLLPFGVTDNGN